MQLNLSRCGSEGTWGPLPRPLPGERQSPACAGFYEWGRRGKAGEVDGWMQSRAEQGGTGQVVGAAAGGKTAAGERSQLGRWVPVVLQQAHQSRQALRLGHSGLEQPRKPHSAPSSTTSTIPHLTYPSLMVGHTVSFDESLINCSSLFSPVAPNGGKILWICACPVADINVSV